MTGGLKILFVLTYYRPHISGLTIYVERLARAMARRGHDVTVLTSHYEKRLPYREVRDGVKIVRVPVLLRISKGVIMPTFPWLAYRWIRRHDVVSVHLPQFEASLLAFLGRFVVRRPVILTYHCDLRLPVGIFNRIVGQVVFVSNYLAGFLANKIVAYTWDYAEHSPYLSRCKNKVRVIYPPVDVPLSRETERMALVRKYGLDGKRVVGFATRFAAEKGVEVLLGAMPYVLSEIPNLKVLYAGEYKNVIGEEAYFRRLEPLIKQYRDHWTFVGVLPPQEMSDYFSVCDCLVVASVNSTESFGLVQVEAMLNGTPVVATNLPGVREPVRVTGMGEVVPVRDGKALAEAIVKVLKNKKAYVRPRETITEIFAIEKTIQQYEELFREEIEVRSAQEGEKADL
jgi:glycosyltransferase involved in cell wall biosynthesis